MAGRTLLPRPNDTGRKWLHRLIFGRAVSRCTLRFECLYGHLVGRDAPFSPNDDAFSNRMLLLFTDGVRCPECGGPMFFVGGEGKC